MKLIKKFSLSFASPVIKTEYIELKRTYVQSFFIVKDIYFFLNLTFLIAYHSLFTLGQSLLFRTLYC